MGDVNFYTVVWILYIFYSIGLDWIGLDWIGLDWIGLDWMEWHWIGLGGMALN